VIDRGRRVTVPGNEEAAVIFGLEMAIQKCGPSISAEGSAEWRQKAAKIAARHGIHVQFSDTEMDDTYRREIEHQAALAASPAPDPARQRQAADYSSRPDQVRSESGPSKRPAEMATAEKTTFGTGIDGIEKAAKAKSEAHKPEPPAHEQHPVSPLNNSLSGFLWRDRRNKGMPSSIPGRMRKACGG
jgi:hypothetical protein